MSENVANNPSGNPEWWPHRYDASRDEVHFIKVRREDHRAAPFLTDEYLPSATQPKAMSRKLAIAAAKTAPLHFIFHSAYCCSTLLARVFDMPGVSMGLKEPVILNDIAGWHTRGAQPEAVTAVLDSVLSLLSRPFSSGEAIIVKPSSIINKLAPQIMHSRPNAKVLFVYAPLEDFLGSIARKGMLGRLWARELMVKQLGDGMINLGIQDDDYLQLTDIQVAAVGWLAQHALFSKLIKQFGHTKIVTLQSDKLMKSPDIAVKELSKYFSLRVGAGELDKVISGPIFQKHSKFEEDFNAEKREVDRLDGMKLHADEIEKVSIWAKIVAQNVGLPLTLPSALL